MIPPPANKAHGAINDKTDNWTDPVFGDYKTCARQVESKCVGHESAGDIKV